MIFHPLFLDWAGGSSSSSVSLSHYSLLTGNSLTDLMKGVLNYRSLCEKGSLKFVELGR